MTSEWHVNREQSNRDHFPYADSQGTSPVLEGDDLKAELSGLLPESVLSALYGFFVAAVKDTLVIGFPSAKQPTHRSKSRCDKTIGTCFTPTDCSNPPTQREKSLAFHAASNFWNLIFVVRRQHLRTSYSVRSPNGPSALQAERRRMT